MKQVVTLILCFCSLIVFGQSAEELHKTAKGLLREGDYDNAILVLTKIIDNNPQYTLANNDLMYANFLKRDFSKAIELGKLYTSLPSVNEQTFQILGMCYKEIALYKEATTMYKTAMAKYPSSGMLYNEMADIEMIEKRPSDAIKLWEKGIELDPNYSANYYNAAQYYAKQKSSVWSIVYGEIFINLESYSLRTAEIKTLLLEEYKTLLLTNDKKYASPFEKLFYQAFSKEITEINAKNLSLIRTKFILNWFYNKNNEAYPFRLFDQQRYLVKEGLFEAYNQWIFGVAQDAAKYKTWVDENAAQANGFKDFQQSRVFKLVTGQYYKN